MGHRVLRVMNEDRVLPDNGFGTHPHSNMEIISYVVSGELEHRDSMENGSIIRAGEFQIITAGSGITHSEFNPSKENETHFYQIWIVPDTNDLAPSYGQKSFSEPTEPKSLQLVASQEETDGSLKINQDIRLYLGHLSAGEEVVLPLSDQRYGWLQIVDGTLELEGTHLTAGDGGALSGHEAPQITSRANTIFLFFDLP